MGLSLSLSRSLPPLSLSRAQKLTSPHPITRQLTPCAPDKQLQYQHAAEKMMMVDGDDDGDDADGDDDDDDGDDDDNDDDDADDNAADDG